MLSGLTTCSDSCAVIVACFCICAICWCRTCKHGGKVCVVTNSCSPRFRSGRTSGRVAADWPAQQQFLLHSSILDAP